MHAADHGPPPVEVAFKLLQRGHHSDVGGPKFATDLEKVGDRPVPKRLEVREVIVVNRLDQQPVRVFQLDVAIEKLPRLPESEGVRNLSGSPLPEGCGPDPEQRDRDHEQTRETGHRVRLHAGVPGGERTASNMKTLRGPYWPSERGDFKADSGSQGFFKGSRVQGFKEPMPMARRQKLT